MNKMFSVGAALFLLGGVSLFAADNLLLARAGENGVPEKVALPPGSQASVTNGKLNVKIPAGKSVIYRVSISPEMHTLRLTGKLRVTDLKKGKEGWMDGRISMRFNGADGKMVGDWPANYNLSGTAEVICNRVYVIPDGAVELLVEPANFGVSGFTEAAGLSLEPGPKNLLVAPNVNGIPANEVKRGNISAVSKDGLASVSIDGSGSFRIAVPVQPSWKALKLSFDMKLSDVKPGDAEWKDARIALRYHDKANKATGPWPNNFHGKGSMDWTHCERVYPIPEKAAYFYVEPANFGVSGKAEFRNLNLQIQE